MFSATDKLGHHRHIVILSVRSTAQDLWVWGLWVLGFSAKLLYRLPGQARSALQKAEFAPLNHTFLLLGCLAGTS
ncbi:hypothetical protein WJX82_009392 [Trebouxia sp. C0006]